MLSNNQGYKDIKSWLGKIAKDNLKSQSKILGRLSSNNGVLMVNELVKRVKNYNSNQIVMVVDSMC